MYHPTINTKCVCVCLWLIYNKSTTLKTEDKRQMSLVISIFFLYFKYNNDIFCSLLHIILMNVLFIHKQQQPKNYTIYYLDSFVLLRTCCLHTQRELFLNFLFGDLGGGFLSRIIKA